MLDGDNLGGTTRRLSGRCDCANILRRTGFALVCLALASLPEWTTAQAQNREHHSDLELRSSDTRLVQAFGWSKKQAMAYVFDGDPVGPWYEASLPGRRAFCMRDVSHQVAGAQALGLAAYNRNMLHRFAENISASRDWCSYWEIDYLNRPAPVDYKNDQEFWYNLPANFDVLDACYRMYLWTGDRAYIEDPVFFNFYKRTVKDYVSRWKLGAGQVMVRENKIQGPPYFRGDPSYEESKPEIVLGVDLLATQYAAYRAMAAIEGIRGDTSAARMSLQNANDVKSLINTKWWNPSEKYFYAFLNQDRHFEGRAGADLLYRDAAEDGPKARGALDAMLKTMRQEPESAVEPQSHYAEILYRYDEPGAAYAEIMDLARPGRLRQEYPEVSYSVVGAIVNGLMGINVVPAASIEEIGQGRKFETVVETLPHLTTNTSWAELRNLSVLRGTITVRHEGRQKTVLTNEGNTDLDWKAVLPGSFATLTVNGKAIQAHSEPDCFGHPLTWVKIGVKPGASSSVETPR